MAEKFTTEQRIVGLGLRPSYTIKPGWDSFVRRDDPDWINPPNAADMGLENSKTYFVIEEGRFERFFSMLDAETAPVPPVEVVHASIFLGPEEKQKLLLRCPAVHENVYADHVTLMHRPDADALKPLPIGEKIVIEVVRIINHERCMTAQVSCWSFSDELDQHVPWWGGEPERVPHITISTDKYTKPVFSNKLLEDTQPQPGDHIVDPIRVVGTVGVLLADGRIVTKREEM